MVEPPRPSTSPGTFLAGVPTAYVERLMGQARKRSFRRGEVVFHEGDAGDSLHVIVRGRFSIRVTTERGEVTTLAILAPGEIFGEMALLRPAAIRSATITAVEAGETRALSREQFQRLTLEHPEVSEVLLTILADKVARYTARLIEAQYVPAELRVVRRVVELVTVYGGDDLPVTQEALAGLAGTSRATVNRVLREEAARGTISLRRGHAVVMDRAALEARAR